ncbi:uncharacterized protein LOC105710741 [Aotus nancymaae]|uniref:uncharacterized protein LOC105710741 n=1 Tax=Aotus nancymaae TaxID=37293 RepID=UPI0030FEB9F8
MRIPECKNQERGWYERPRSHSRKTLLNSLKNEYSFKFVSSTNSLYFQSCLGVPCSEDTGDIRSDVRKQAVKISLCNWVTQVLPDKEEPILSVPGDPDLVDILQKDIWIHYNDDIMLTGQDAHEVAVHQRPWKDTCPAEEKPAPDYKDVCCREAEEEIQHGGYSTQLWSKTLGPNSCLLPIQILRHDKFASIF